MAQFDVGLGWSAKDGWLTQSPNVTIANISMIGGPDYPNQPIPTNRETYADISAGGFIYLHYRTQYVSVNMYVASATDAPILVAGYKEEGRTSADWSAGFWFMSPVQNAVVKTAHSVNHNINTLVCSSYDSTTGLYYTPNFYSLSAIVNNEVTITAGNFNTLRNALDAVQITNLSFNKINSGYAVACVAKWRTSADVVIQSPILISSKSEFTEMTVSGAYQLATYRTRRDGMTFYMSFYQDIPDDLSTLFPIYDISSPEEPYANLDELFNLICAPDQANVIVTETLDPYEDFPHTEEDGGEPDPDPEDDEIEEADLPTMSFATAGFCRIYRPSFSQVSALASYMWTDQNFLQTVINHLKQILENPIDAIISLSIVPCVPDVLADEEVKVMYVPTGVYMPPVQRQFVEVDCGNYTLKEMYGSALDYNPYTNVQLYLPYVGIVQLDTDEVMGKTLSVGYRIDIVTGVCCAYVKAGGDVLYQFSGHCSIQQPITSADFSGYINAALAAGKLVASIAAAGAGAPAVAATLAGAPTPSISGTESKTVETERNPNTGRQITVGTRRRESQTYNPGASFGEVATRGVSNTVGAVMNSKTIVQHSGGFSGNSGFMAAVRRPYLIVTRPRIANPENYGKYNGRPSMIYLNLGDCTGFTQVQSIQLTGIDATNPELSEIATLLNSGVIL